MDAIEPNVSALVVFALMWLTTCVAFFFLTGHLPVRAAPPDVRSGYGPLLVWVNVLLFGVILVATLSYAVRELRWTSLMIVGGFVFLFTPIIVQEMPRVLRDTRRGLLVIAAGLLSAAALLYVFY